MPSVLSKAIDAALVDGKLNLTETKKLLDAVGPAVSGAEARALADVYERATSVPGAGEPIAATKTALERLDQLFVAEGIPAGGNKERLRRDLQVKLENVALGEPLTKAPRVNSYPTLTLRDARGDGGTRDMLYLRPGSGRAYLRTDGPSASAKPRWYGPFETPTLAQGRLSPLAPGQLSPDRVNWIRTSLQQDLGHVMFDHPSLPSGAFVDLGLLHATVGEQYRVFLPAPPAGGTLETSTQYVVRREAGSSPPRYSALVDVAPFVDPATDGKVSPAMKQRARKQFMEREFAETQGWHAGAPPSSTKLVRASVATYADAYFVVGSTGGALIDPDKSSQLYFRHRSGNVWAGPFAVEPLYPT